MQDVTSQKDLQLQEITPEDLRPVARFIARVSGFDVPLNRAVQRLSWILLENPARETGSPLGWYLRNTSTEIVGCMCCAPQKFSFGEKIITLMMANSFYVDTIHRGAGTAIFLKYLALGHRYPLFVSSANPTVAQMWKRLGGYSLGCSDHEVLGVLRWNPILAETFYRKSGSNFLARAAGSVGSPALKLFRSLPAVTTSSFVPIASPEEAASLCPDPLSDRLTAVRDASYFRWRYFSSADPTTRLFAFRLGRCEKQHLVGVNMRNRGYRQQIRALHVLDVWGEATPDVYGAIAACLAREYRGQADTLVFRCLDSSQRNALTDKGFRVRPFAAPIAWCIDKFGLLPTKSWYFVPADGDMSL
jgi:hypothetical protein